MERVARNIIKVANRTTGGDRPTITLKAKDLAQSAAGSCSCTLGDTSVLVTAVSDKTGKLSASSFVPLTVDYKQKAAAFGRIPMNHFRRDIGFTEQEILTSRMIDRSIRTGFANGFCHETQIVCSLSAVDGHNDPDVLAINGASASLSISDIPWDGPVGAVRMGLVGENYIVNPSRREQENSRLSMVLTANKLGNVVMLEGSCKEPVLMNDILQSMKKGIKECQLVIEAISMLTKSVGRPKRVLDLKHMPSLEQRKLAFSLSATELQDILSNHKFDKASRDEAIQEVRTRLIEGMKEKYPGIDDSTITWAFSYVTKETYKKVLRNSLTRCDGRKLTTIRPITCNVNIHKPLHGSAIFKRGQTQVFCSTTLDSPDLAFRSDSMTHLLSGVKEKNFMLHYEFPPFATNEIGRIAAMPGRREIGHGALAEKAIRPIVPEQNSMAVRLNCEVLESNGSSSMASVCAGSLSLMDAGVNINEHVAGVAMGLVSVYGGMSLDNSPITDSKDDQHFILTDILGFEDYIGDMDFKIAGTKKAITALQLDVKPKCGIPLAILQKAIQQAHTARGEIIRKMEAAIKESRKEVKDSHPVIKKIHIPAHKRAKFIGLGGSNLRKLTAQIGVGITACEGADAGTGMTIGGAPRDNYVIFAPNKDAMEEAEEFIKKILEDSHKVPELEFNGIYTATVQEIRDNGVMITLYPDMIPTLLPLAQLDLRVVAHPSALNLEVGQKIQVKYFGRDPVSGHMRLSRKSLMMSSVPRVHQLDRESKPLGNK